MEGFPVAGLTGLLQTMEARNSYNPPPLLGAVGLARLPIHKIQSWLLAALHVLSLWIWGWKCYSRKLMASSHLLLSIHVKSVNLQYLQQSPSIRLPAFPSRSFHLSYFLDKNLSWDATSGFQQDLDFFSSFLQLDWRLRGLNACFGSKDWAGA